MNKLTYDPCLLYTNNNGFGVVRLQTNNTLFLANNIFTTAKDLELKEAKFLAKKREKLTPTTLIKFNGGQIKLNNNLILLTQECQC